MSKKRTFVNICPRPNVDKPPPAPAKNVDKRTPGMIDKAKFRCISIVFLNVSRGTFANICSP